MNYNPILYGEGTEERIISAETIYGKENVVQLFFRDEDDTIRSEYRKYLPFIYISSDDPINNSLYESTDTTQLFGSNHYDKLIRSDNYSTIKWISKESESHYKPYLQAQWFIDTGNTLFKGMSFDDPLRFYLDIEVYTSGDHDFPNAQRDGDKIIIITGHDNRGRDYLWRLDDYYDEASMLESFIKDFREVDPDIIVMHNGFGFDFPYIRDRCLKRNVKFGIGRDGSEPRTFETSIKFAEKSDEYENFQVYGRHIYDTYFMAKQFDIFYRGLEGYGLKYCAEFLGGIEGERTYIAGEDISDYWDVKRDELLKYAMDDVYETRLLDKNWGKAVFAMSQMIPLPSQDVSRYGTGNLIDQIFVRYYHDRLWSLPKADPQRSLKGGFAHTYRYGYVGEDMIYEDISSLYPSLAELLEIQPPKDELKLFSKFVPLLKESRYKAKYKAKELYEEAKKANSEDEKNNLLFEASSTNATNETLKRLLNTAAYGWLVWAYGMFNAYDEGERITTWGQKIIKRIVKESEGLGAEALKVDTDGALVVVPEEHRGDKESEEQFIKRVERATNEWLTEVLGYDNEGVVLEHDGRYEKAIMFDDKSYVLLSHDGDKKVKGNTLTGRSNEKFTLDFINNCVDYVLDEQPEKLASEYKKWKGMIENKLMSVDLVKKKQSINQSLEQYRNKIESGQYRIPQYEAALKADRNLMQGDVVETWVEEPEPIEKEYKTRENKMVIPNLSASDKVRLAKNFNGNIDRKHYLNRLDKTAIKLLPITGPKLFGELFDIRIPKKDKFKLVDVMGIHRFNEYYPDFSWTSKYVEKLSDKQQKEFNELGLTFDE